MTLGGFALAVGILVDNAHGRDRKHRASRRAWTSRLHQSIVAGASEVAVPTLLSTLCICIVFVPVFLLQGTAKYLFSPLSLSVIGALLASLALSFTLVPVLFNHLMRRSVHAYETESQHRAVAGTVPRAMLSCAFKLRSSAVSRGSAKATATHSPGLCRRRERRSAFFADSDGRLRVAVSAARARFLSASGCRPDAPACARARRHPARTNAAILLPRSKRKSAGRSATRRSTSCSTISGCRTAASTSR